MSKQKYENLLKGLENNISSIPDEEILKEEENPEDLLKLKESMLNTVRRFKYAGKQE